MSEGKMLKANTSSTKKAITAKRPIKKEFSTKKATAKIVAKKVGKVTSIEKTKKNKKTALPKFKVPVKLEVKKMENEEKKINEEPVVQNEPVVEPAKEAPVVKSKKKKDIRSALLIILFIFLFAFVMGIPYINEWIDSVKKDTGLSEIERKAREIEKEQERQNSKAKEKENSKEQEKISVLICTSQPKAYENYDATIVEKFIYNSKGLVIESSKATTYKFNTQTDKYNELKNQCNENSLKYVEKKGYEIACSYNDTEVVMEDKFDLALFTTINDGMTKIEANANYKDKIDDVKKKQETLGYTCE